MIRHLGTKITSFLIFASFLLAGSPAQSDDHQNSDINNMSNGTIEAAQLTLCTLNAGKTLKDVEHVKNELNKVFSENAEKFYRI